MPPHEGQREMLCNLLENPPNPSEREVKYVLLTWNLTFHSLPGTRGLSERKSVCLNIWGKIVVNISLGLHFFNSLPCLINEWFNHPSLQFPSG